jgi:hypothetical protein
MTKEDFGYYAMLYGCEDLGLDPVEIVLFTGFFMGNPEINAVALMKDKKIAIQEDWFNQANYDEIAITIFHEIRHFYQNKKITEFDEENVGVISFALIKWRQNFKDYISPNRKNELKYLKQDIEKDACKYSKETYKKFAKFCNQFCSYEKEMKEFY